MEDATGREAIHAEVKAQMEMMGDMVAEFNQSKVGSYRRNGKVVRGYSRRGGGSLSGQKPIRDRGQYGEVSFTPLEQGGRAALMLGGTAGGARLGGMAGKMAGAKLGKKGLLYWLGITIAGAIAGRTISSKASDRFIKERAHLRTYPEHFDYDSEMNRKRQGMQEKKLDPAKISKVLARSQGNLVRRDRKARRAYGLSERSY